MSAVRRWPPESLATQAECFAALETLIQNGAVIEGAGFRIAQDDAPDFGNVTEPCIVLTQFVNGQRQRSGHDTLLDAMRALVKP